MFTTPGPYVPLSDVINNHLVRDQETGKDTFRNPGDERLLLEMLKSSYWALRDPETRQVYLAKRTTHEQPSGGILFELENPEVIELLLNDFSLLTNGDVATQAAANNAMKSFAGSAMLLNKEPGIRWAKSSDGAFWLDLGREDQRCIRVSPEGWTVETAPGAWFRRTAAIGEIPVPVPGGNWGEFWKQLTLVAADIPLVRGWMVQSCVPGMVECPLLFGSGFQGSGKSVQTQMIGMAACDSTDRFSIKRDTTPRDIMVATGNAWGTMIDNLSKIDQDTGDVLCRIYSGETHTERKLNTNGGLFRLTVRRPLLATGIDPRFPNDLKSRTVHIKFPELDGTPLNRKQGDVWADFKKIRPRVMGVVLSDLVHVMSTPDPVIAGLPRMSDFFVTAAKLDAKYGDGDSLARWNEVLAADASDSTTSDPLWAAMATSLKGPWRGTSMQLLNTIDPHGDHKREHRNLWPRSGQAMTTFLRRSQPALRASGWHIKEFPAPRPNRAAEWEITPPDGVAGVHVVGCRCDECSKLPHVGGCHCKVCDPDM